MTVASAAGQIRVDASSTATAPDGSTWALAYPSFPQALAAGGTTPGLTYWIAEGTYAPADLGANSTFQLPTGTRLVGGFVTGDPNEQNRTGSAANTILTGLVPAATPYNVFHVVSVTPGEDEVLLDSLTIREGVASGPAAGTTSRGGGVYAVGTDLRMRDCIVTQNSATFGGGLYFEGQPGAALGDGFRAERCFFFSNSAVVRGGAIEFAALGIPDSPSEGFTGEEVSWLYNCIFLRNLAGSDGPQEDPAREVGGGAINFENRIGRVTTTTSLSTGRDPRGWTVRVVNCRFSDNISASVGTSCRIRPAQSVDGGRIVFDLCTVAADVLMTSDAFVPVGGAIFLTAPEMVTNPPNPDSALNRRSPLLVSCIVLAPNDSPANTSGGDAVNGGPGAVGQLPIGALNATQITAEYSNIETLGLAPFANDTNNIDADPLFVNFAFRDFRLSSSASPCWDTGIYVLTNQLALDYPDLDDNPLTDRLPTDLLVTARLIGARVDMGCHELPASGSN